MGRPRQARAGPRTVGGQRRENSTQGPASLTEWLTQLRCYFYELLRLLPLLLIRGLRWCLADWSQDRQYIRGPHYVTVLYTHHGYLLVLSYQSVRCRSLRSLQRKAALASLHI